MPGLPRLLPLLLALGLCGCASFSGQLKEGDRLAEQGRFDEAEEAYRKAQAKNPESPEPKERLDKLAAGRAQDEVRKGDQARDQGKLAEAAEHYRRAETLKPGGTGAPQALRGALDAKVKEGQAHLAADRPEEALEAFESVLKQEGGHAKAKQGAKDARLKLAPRVFADAEAAEREGRLGAALVQFTRAEQLEPGAARNARGKAESVRAKLLDEVTFVVETQEVVDRAKSPEVSDRLTPGRLAAALPRGLPLRLMAQAPASARGVRTQVTVEKVDTLYERKTQSKSAKFPVGRRQVENPDWKKLEEKLQAAERGLGDAERVVWVRIEALHEEERKLDDARSLFERCQVASVASCAEALRICRNAVGTSSCDVPTTCDADACRLFADGAVKSENAYNQARVRLRDATELLGKRRDEVLRAREQRLRVPALTEEAAFGEFPYEIEAHTATLRAAVSFQLDPLDPSLPRAAVQTRDFVARSEDQTHRAYDLYGVRPDPLELESEKELKRKAGESALEALAQAVRAELDRARGPSREDARRAVQRHGLTEEVTELVVRAVLLYPDERPQDLLEALGKTYHLPQPQALYGR